MINAFGINMFTILKYYACLLTTCFIMGSNLHDEYVVFQNLPLTAALGKLSKVTDSIIVLETNPEVNIDILLPKNYTKETAIDALNFGLNKHGLTLIRNDRFLTLIDIRNTLQRTLLIYSGNDYQLLNKTYNIITQIIPIKHLKSQELINNLQSFVSDEGKLIVNQDSNTIILTDTEINVRRIMNIINILDTVVVQNSVIKVFSIKFADAKELVSEFKTLFQDNSVFANDIVSNNQQIL